MSKRNKYRIIDWEDSRLFFIVFGLAVATLSYFNLIIAGIFLIVGMYLFYYERKLIKEKEKFITEIIEDLNTDFDDLAKNMVFNMPFPMAIVKKNGNFKWYNAQFKNLFPQEDLMESSIIKAVKVFKLENINNPGDSGVFKGEIADRMYDFHYNSIENKKDKSDMSILVYLLDNTEDYKIKKAYENESMAIGILTLDNYDEIKTDTEEMSRPILFAEIDKLLGSYFAKYNSFLRKYEQDKYIVVTERKFLTEMKDDKFSVVESIRNLTDKNRISPTVSMGMGISSRNPYENYKEAQIALDIALGRGGDQMVFKDKENLEYLGGKNKALEKRSKIKSRVISHALAKLILESSEVFVMGHKNPDMDSFGSCMGIVEAARKMGKICYFVLNEVTPAIRNVYEKVMEKYKGFDRIITKPEDAENICSKTSLLVVLDTHRVNSTEAPKLLELTDKIVLIDHHRRGKDYIRNTTMTHLEPYASSASELVTELLHYMFEKLYIHPVVAEVLLAGITVDTKNFYFQTGVRTFEAASILKRQGADSIEVKQLFRDEFETVKYKSEVVANSKKYRDNIAIGILDKPIEEAVLVSAQAADALLNVMDIEASFVMAKVDEKIHISGRSLGKISVQLILEKIGGGGHLSAAGAQLQCDMEEAVVTLKKAIDEYLEEDRKNEDNID